MKKVVFVTGSLSDGGAEKVMSILASKCADMGNEVTLVVLRNKKIVYPVSSNVNLIHFNFSGKMSVIKKIRELHKVLKEARAQAVIPFLSEISLYTLIANIGVGTVSSFGSSGSITGVFIVSGVSILGVTLTSVPLLSS